MFHDRIPAFLIFCLAAALGTAAAPRAEPLLDWLLESLEQAEIPGYDLQEFLPAAGWFPEADLPLPGVDGPPRLLPLGPGLRMRTNLSPHADWWRWILWEADAHLELDPELQVRNSAQRSRAAKCMALCWRITGRGAYLDGARRFLAAVPPPPEVRGPEGDPGSDWGGWVAAAGRLRHYSVAYDLVREALPPAERRGVEGALAAMARRLHRWLPLAGSNNHSAIMGTGIATCALAVSPDLGGSSTPADWFADGLRAVRRGLAVIDRDGGCREGPYYAEFLARDLVPLMVYLKEAAGLNAFAGQAVASWIQWMEDLRRPDGSMPLCDDGWVDPVLWRPLAAGSHLLGPEMAWSMEQEGPPESYLENMVEAFCAMPAGLAARPPVRPSTRAYPLSGQAVLRGGWERDTFYALLQGESAERRAVYHEHLDPAQLSISALGENFIAAPGYGAGGSGNPDHDRLASAVAQNIPLVDGRGPDPNPLFGDPPGALPLNGLDGPQLDWAETGYLLDELRVRREVLMVAGGLLLVFDRLEGGTAERSLGQRWRGRGRWHGEGPGRGSWRLGERELEWRSLDPLPPRTEIRREWGSWNWFRGEVQEVLLAECAPRREARAACLFLPRLGGRAWRLRIREHLLEGPGRAWRLKSEGGSGWILRAPPEAALAMSVMLFPEGPLRLEADGLALYWEDDSGLRSWYLSGRAGESGGREIGVRDARGSWIRFPDRFSGAEGEARTGFPPEGIRPFRAGRGGTRPALEWMARRRGFQGTGRPEEPELPPPVEIRLAAESETQWELVQALQRGIAGPREGPRARRLRWLAGLAVLQYDPAALSGLRLPLKTASRLDLKGRLKWEFSGFLSPGASRLRRGRIEHRDLRGNLRSLRLEQTSAAALHSALLLERGTRRLRLGHHRQPGADALELEAARREETFSRVSLRLEPAEWGRELELLCGGPRGEVRVGGAYFRERGASYALCYKHSLRRLRFRLRAAEEPARRNMRLEAAWFPGASRLGAALEGEPGDWIPEAELEPVLGNTRAALRLRDRDLARGELRLRAAARDQRMRLFLRLDRGAPRPVYHERLEVERRGRAGWYLLNARQVFDEDNRSRHLFGLRRELNVTPRWALSLGLGADSRRAGLRSALGGLRWLARKAWCLDTALSLERGKAGGLELRLAGPWLECAFDARWSRGRADSIELELGNGRGQSLLYRRDQRGSWIWGGVGWNW